MKVLMFGWEFPPKIYGGLAVASYGITKGLSLQGDVETTFCMPKPTGEEEDFLKIVGMNQVPIVWRDVDYNYLKSRLTRNMTPEDYYSFRDHIYSDFSYMHVNDIGCMDFAGGYPGNLHEEINNFSVIAGVVARQQEFDIIHADFPVAYELDSWFGILVEDTVIKGVSLDEQGVSGNFEFVKVEETVSVRLQK